MQCPGALRRPLRDIIKSIGSVEQHGQLPSPCNRCVPPPDSRRCNTTPTQVRLRTCFAHHGHLPRHVGKSARADLRHHEARHQSNASRSYSDSASSRTVAAAKRNLRQDEDSAPPTFRGIRYYSPNAEHEKIDYRSVSVAKEAQEETGGSMKLYAGLMDELATGCQSGKSREPRENTWATAMERHRESKSPGYGLDSEMDIPNQSDPSPSFRDEVRSIEESLTPQYHEAARAAAESLARRTERAARRQLERHPNSSTQWHLIFNMLERNTVVRKGGHARIVETISLPKRCAAIFNDSANAAILEIMQRTYSHVQMGETVDHDDLVDGTNVQDHHAFRSLTLLGTKTENDAAIEILPNYLLVLPMKGGTSDGSLTAKSLRRGNARVHTTRKPGRALEPAQPEQEPFTVSDIENLEKEIDTLTSSSCTSFVPSRAVWATERDRPHEDPWKLLQRPPLKTAIAITEYVRNLTTTLPALVRRKLRGVHAWDASFSQHHAGLVTKEMLSLVSDSQLMGNITSMTVDRMAQYFAHHHNIAAFRKMYTSLEQNGYVFTTRNYNVGFSVAARFGDVHNFQYLLSLMLQRGRAPDPITWAQFYHLTQIHSLRRAEIIAERMHRKGLLKNSKAALEIVLSAVRRDLQETLDSSGDLASFIRLYDNKFGVSYGLKEFNWLSPIVGGEMIYVLLAAGRLTDAVDVLQEIWKRDESAVIHVPILNAFLRSARRGKDPHAAVLYLQRFRVGKSGSLIPGAATYMSLFEVAWHCRCYNMLRVVWRYACASGQVVPAMRTQVMWSLTSVTSQEENASDNDGWKFWAGKFAIGVADGLDRSEHNLAISEMVTEPCSPAFDADAMHKPISKTPGAAHVVANANRSKDGELNDRARYREIRTGLSTRERAILRLSGQSEDHTREEELKKLLGQDFDEAMSCQPKRPLADILKEAWQMDMQWAKQGVGSTTKMDHGILAEMMVQGISVPMEAGDFTKHVRPWEIPHKTQRRKSM